MNRVILHRTLRQFRRQFLADFRQVTEQDLHTILTSSSEMLLTVFATRYNYSREEAIGAWNEFVLRHIDGQPRKPAQSTEPSVVSA